MDFRQADDMSLVVFSGLALGMVWVCLRAIRISDHWKKWSVVLAVVVLLFSAGAISGLVAQSFVPFGPLLFTLIFVSALSFSFSAAGKQVAGALSLGALIGFQGFRLPLELVLHHWASIETIPATMTWTGQNWDVLAGLVALVGLPWVQKSRKFAWVVNTFGFLLLLNVMRVVIFSSPLPFAWQLDNPLRLIAYFPYCLIGPLFVMPALVGHLLTFRKLLSKA